jgi:spermidine synthase
MNSRRLFLAAYVASGFAALVYEVAWTRLLTLYLGHTIAAASTVVATFMGGLVIGAAGGAYLAPKLSPRRALQTYAALEAVVLLGAVTLAWQLEALVPLLRWAYRDGDGGLLFSLVRIACCAGVAMVPTIALGATFPLGIRWYAGAATHPGRVGGALYAANTAGAALGAPAAGFLLIPALGVTGATLVGAAATALAIALAVMLSRRPDEDAGGAVAQAARAPAVARKKSARAPAKLPAPVGRPGLAAAILVLTGFATFMFEIAWTRVFSIVLGPSTYAFAATLTAFIAGLAAGGAAGAFIAGRARRPALALAVALTFAACAAAAASAYAGGPLLRALLADLVAPSQAFEWLLLKRSALVMAIVGPLAFGLGVSFPLVLELSGQHDGSMARRLGWLYAVNTAASVVGSLVAGFVAIPLIGLQHTILAATIALIVAAFVVAIGSAMAARLPWAAVAVPLAAVAAAAWGLAPWDRELIVSGAYKYAPYVPPGQDLETALKAGSLLYYRDGATGTVSVKELTGRRSLSIDGKVDASTVADMLTQKTLAHLPLLLHDGPRRVCIIGLGSGVTLASALVHPIDSVDVVEISPEVVEASSWFSAHNHDALADPRTRLLVGDGRSHIALSERTYDVIVSEPSNPWMAGVAALFTREFFTAVRARLSPSGIFCQWAHTYDISDRDLRSVAATFAAVFPNGTMWLVGDGDLLFIGSADAIEPRLENIEAAWTRPGVAADLATVSALEPFAYASLFVGGPAELKRYGAGAEVQRDDRMGLEFSGPRAVNSAESNGNAIVLRQLQAQGKAPPAIAQSHAAAGPAEWRHRGAMMLQAGAYHQAYEDFGRALSLDPADVGALEGFVRAAAGAHREADAIAVLEAAATAHPASPAVWIGLSKAHAATGAFDRAIASALRARAAAAQDPAPLEHLASLYADVGDAAALRPLVEELQRAFPARTAASYNAAVLHFLSGRLQDALTMGQRTITLDPGYAAAYNLLGAINANLGHPQEARTAFEQALRLDPRESTAYTNLAVLELSSGNRARAADLYAQALTLDPGSEAAKDGLAQAR